MSKHTPPLRSTSSASSTKSGSSDAESDTTLEDVDAYIEECGFGHPLQRMVELDSIRSPPSPALYKSPSSSASSLLHDFDFETVVEELLAEYPSSAPELRDLVIVEPSQASRASLMIKGVSRTSTELCLLLHLNGEEIRADPWNPAPRILCTVPRGDRVFLCMERLFEFNQPPFKTVANYIDFLRQCLEGLTFLHEHKIAHVGYKEPYCLMVAIGTSSIDNFDRSRYPVRYYHTDFSQAVRFDSSSQALSPAQQYSSFKCDVQECGLMIDQLLENVPKIGPKFKSLVHAMTKGGFGADDSRKLFEALCKSLEASVFDTPITSPIP